MFKVVPIALGVLTLYIAWCVASKDEEWCQRSDSKHAWPE